MRSCGLWKPEPALGKTIIAGAAGGSSHLYRLCHGWTELSFPPDKPGQSGARLRFFGHETHDLHWWQSTAALGQQFQ